VTVNAVMPGPINTGMTAAIGEDDRRRFARRRVALRRYGEPGEVAQAILNLVLPASSYTQGACLRVDGGMLTVA
jgi:3-oxoacyl-[acyl-carrier protein] reductase